MLNQHHRQLLKSHAKARDNRQGPTLDEVIEGIKAQAPEKFHTDATLKERVFYHEPRHNLPSAGCIIPLPVEMRI